MALRPGTLRTCPIFSERVTRWSKTVARFLSVEMFVQALGFAAGILLVRQLSKEEPAFFTVAITMQGTMNMLCDNGVGAEISAIGGGVWQSRQRFGQLITSALNMRRLAVLTTVIVTPVLLVLLLRKEATITHAALIAGAVLLGLYFQISIGVLQHVPFLNLQWQRLQKINFWSSALRLLVLWAAYYTVLDAVTALLATTVTSAAIHFHLRNWVPELIDMTAPENPEHRRKLVGLVKSQAPNGIFFRFQSQITIWLINIFGSASSLADVGALGRLTAIFSVVGSVVGNLVVPRFVRCREAAQLWSRYGQIVGVTAGVGVLLAAAAAVPGKECSGKSSPAAKQLLTT